MRGPSPLASFLSGVFVARPTPAPACDPRSILDQCRSLMSARGDSSTVRLARTILATYRALSETEKDAFFAYLLGDLDIDPAEVAARAQEYATAPGPQTLAALHRASEPARQELLRKLNQADGATTHLVAMRVDLLRRMRDTPDLGRIDLDFEHLFASWFNRGFLMLNRINWSTPATILEKIIAYEAVHQINDWNDLRRRTQPTDRRCYAYFHPRMPEEPLIFVEVALTAGVPGSVQAVLSEDRTPIPATEADTAVFYSISNCQKGLKGVSFGNSLIKHVVADLSEELPNLHTFITLSPVPGLNGWLAEQDSDGPPQAAAIEAARTARQPDAAPPAEIARTDALREIAADYLTNAKRPDGLPWDSVARFHLSNGARIENVLSEADLSPNGLRQSLGVMVNYKYDSRHVERRSEAFASDGKVSVSRAVQALARAGQSQKPNPR